MKKTIRLTESDLARIVRRVIREESSKIGGVLSCVATASQLKLTDLEKISSCKTLNTESGQTMTNLKSCLAGAKSIIDEKTKNMDFFDKARYYTNLTTETAKCIYNK
jgi:hypothetical protein